VSDLVLTGAAVGLQSLEGLLFDSNKPFTYCGICGAVFQHEADRSPIKVFQRQKADFSYRLENVALFALGERKRWSQKHAKLHSSTEHRLLALSGRHLTPEAQHKLAAFGVIDVKGLVLDDEIEHALNSSSAVPQNDAEG
jgi:hypothetical protein